MTTIDMFKFQIGDVVQFISASNHKMLIIEQHLQICVGGQQLKYLTRPFGRARHEGIAKDYTFYNEMELELEPVKDEDTPKVDPRVTNKVD